ncbi:MAG: CDP-diacylglycerol--glycerol-3-phosphate 3-phosphatidyltransferase [Treponema sp.]|nr:CDP-diacylglycerol--glycerol-3-phosphate 3-phosphatidyltransferase [Treponema sp.]
MTLANKITSLRLILAPVFFIVYLHPGIDGAFFHSAGFLAILWGLFIVIECSDWLDGLVARSRNEVSDFGKIFDPFSDTLVRVTYFLCFITSGLLPVIPFLVILFREFGILFIRLLMMQKGVVMGARSGGKLKAVFYMLTGLACMLSLTFTNIGYQSIGVVFHQAALIIFIISMAIALVSFADYFLLYRKTAKK